MKKLSCFVALIGMMTCGLFSGCNENGKSIMAVESFDVKEPIVYMEVGDVHTIEIINIEPEFAVLDPQYLKFDDNYDPDIVQIKEYNMTLTAIGAGTTVVDIFYYNGQETISADIRVYVSGVPPEPEPEPEVSIHKIWLADYSTPTDKYHVLFDLTDPANAMVGESGYYTPDLKEGQFLKYSNEPIPYTVSENADGTSGQLRFYDGEIDISYNYRDLTETSVVLEQLNVDNDTPVTATLYTDEFEWVSY